MDNKRNNWQVWVALMTVVVVIVGVGGCRSAAVDDGPVARSYQTKIYQDKGGDRLVVASGGDVEVRSGGTLDLQSGSTFNVDADVDVDGDSFDVDVTGAISLDAGAASHFNVAGAGIDLTLESEAGRLIVKGDEAAATAVHIDANDAVTTGLTIDVGSVSGMLVNGGVTNIGGGTPGVATGDNDLYVTADLEVDNVLDVDGSVDVDGTGVDIDLSAAFSIDGDTASNISLAAQDLTIEAETGTVIIKGDEAAADAITLDADDAAGVGVTIAVGSSGGLNIGGGLTDIGGGTCGTAAGDNDLCVAADLEVDNVLDVDGSVDVDGTGVDIDLSAAFSIDGDAASNINVAGAGIDLTLESEAGRLIVKADEAAATAVHIDANDAVTTGLTIDVGSVSGMLVNGGLTNIGGGSPAVAAGDNDLYVTADLEVDGETELDGALDADSTANIAGALTLQALLYPSFADETITDGETLTPTVTVYNLDSGGNVTMTLAVCSTDGQLLVLVGDDANNILIADTNVRTNDGSTQTIGQYDMITWVCIDAEWVELSESNNS